VKMKSHGVRFQGERGGSKSGSGGKEGRSYRDDGPAAGPRHSANQSDCPVDSPHDGVHFGEGLLDLAASLGCHKVGCRLVERAHISVLTRLGRFD